jgi:hypothetical protein
MSAVTVLQVTFLTLWQTYLSVYRTHCLKVMFSEIDIRYRLKLIAV